MPTRRSVLASALAAGASISAISSAHAGSMRPFDEAWFETAQKAGRPILVDVTAPWCPICLVQGLTLAVLRNDQRYRELLVLTVDFDSQKPLLRRFNVRSQGTWIVFRGATETGRVVGATAAAHLDAVLATAL